MLASWTTQQPQLQSLPVCLTALVSIPLSLQLARQAMPVAMAQVTLVVAGLVTLAGANSRQVTHPEETVTQSVQLVDHPATGDGVVESPLVLTYQDFSLHNRKALLSACHFHLQFL
jgi:uncharacterized membrane protein